MTPVVASAPAAILVPLGAAFIMPVVGRFVTHFRPALSALALVIAGWILLDMAEPVLNGQTLVYWMSGWEPRDGLAIGISLSIDAWGWLVAMIAVVIGLSSVVYAAGYLRGETGHETYYVLILLLVTGLIGFALSGDLFNQFVWLEVFSVAAFALTAFHTEDGQSIEAAFKYLITNSIAAFFVAIGLALLYMNTGALNLAHVARAFKPTYGGLIGIALLVGGYATKAALVPWHFWLPDAHAAAPAPISAVFSGALIKVGVYAVARAVLTLVPPEQAGPLHSALIAAGVVSILVGGIQMLHQKQIKRILAYSSVAQMGYIVLGIGIGTPVALAGAALHLLHHALVKAALFMGVGAVIRQTGAHELDECGGLARKMPLTTALVVLGSLALAGLPFTSGYLGKALIGEAAKEAGLDGLIVVVVSIGMFTLAGMIRLAWRIFAGEHRSAAAGSAHEAPPILLIPVAALLFGSLAMGLLAEPLTARLGAPVANSLYHREAYLTAVMGEAHAESPVPAEHPISAPEPGDVSHWGTSLIAVLGGLALAILSLRKPFAPHTPAHRFVREGRRITLFLRRWHSGIVTEYAMWNSAGTALILLFAIGPR